MAGNTWNAEQYDTTFGFVGRYGDDVASLLDVHPGDRILDLGCGTGRHAALLAERGAWVIGLDADADMIATARRDHPQVTFIQGDATDFTREDLGVESGLDGCFSNAALHWMTPQADVLANVRAVLRQGAPFVAEMGGADNISALDASLRQALDDLALDVEVARNYFPTTGQQATALEAAGFRVTYATWFRRPTPLAPGTTAADWTRHFRSRVWEGVPQAVHEGLAAAVDLHAEKRGLHVDGGWQADYCRLRFVAVAV
jgi:trans-aconitate methyltransferase